MSKHENFMLNTDFESLRNDGQVSLSITVPASVTIPAGGQHVMTSDTTVGSSDGLINAKVKNNRSGPNTIDSPAGADAWYSSGIQLAYTRTTTIGGNPAPYTTGVSVYRLSGGRLRCSVAVSNPYNVPMTTMNQTDVYTFSVRSILPPKF